MCIRGAINQSLVTRVARRGKGRERKRVRGKGKKMGNLSQSQ